MYYPPEQFRMLDEAHALTDSLQGLAPKLYETLNAARADLLDRYPSDLFWDNQNNANMPRLINQRCARIWNDESWVLSDKCGYLHLREGSSGAARDPAPRGSGDGQAAQDECHQSVPRILYAGNLQRGWGPQKAFTGRSVRARWQGISGFERHQTDSGVEGNG